MSKVPYTWCYFEDKRKYANARLASDALAICIQEYRAGATHRKECDFYECSRCGGWHLTSDQMIRTGGSQRRR